MSYLGHRVKGGGVANNTNYRHPAVVVHDGISTFPKRKKITIEMSR